MRKAWQKIVAAISGRPVKARRRVTGWSVRFETEAGVCIGRFKTKREAREATATQPGGGALPLPCYGKRGT